MGVRNVSAVAQGGPTVTPTLPATLAGSIVLIGVFQRDGAGMGYTVPAGFDLVARTSASPADDWPLIVYAGTPAAGSTAFAVTRDNAAGPDPLGAVAVEITGNVEIDDVLTLGPSSGTPLFDDTSVGGARTAVAFVHARHDTDQAFTPAASWTEALDDDVDPSGVTGPQLAVGYREIASAGTYDLGWTAPTDDRAGVLVILEAALTPPVDPDPDPYVPPEPARALLEAYLPAEGAARWDEAVWDVDTWSESVWTDITYLGVSVDLAWGTNQPELGILAPTVAGKGTIITHDPERLLDPANADSPYYPHVRPGLPMRLSHRSKVIRRFHVDRAQYQYSPPRRTPTTPRRAVTHGPILVTDNVAVLAMAEVPSDTILPDTLFARMAAVVAASDVRVTVGAAPRGVDPELAPWVAGNFRAWAVIAASAAEVGWVPYIDNLGVLRARAWADPRDRGGEIASPELVDLTVISADDGLFSVVEVEDVDDGPLVRRITPTPRYGRRVHRRTLDTIDGEAYAERILDDRGREALRWRIGAVRPLDADSVEWYAGLDVNELVAIYHDATDPVVETMARVLGMRVTVRDLGDAAGPDWRFYPAAATEGIEPLVADPLPFGTPSNLILVDDASGEWLYPDGAYSIEA